MTTMAWSRWSEFPLLSPNSWLLMLLLQNSVMCFVFPTEKPVNNGSVLTVPRGTEATCRPLSQCPTLQTLMAANAKALDEFESCGTNVAEDKKLYKCPDKLGNDNGDICTCIPVTRCPILMKLVRNREFQALKQHMDCGYEGKIPKYCCPQLSKRSHSENNVAVQRTDNNNDDDDDKKKDNDEDDDNGNDSNNDGNDDFVCGFQSSLKIVGGTDADDHEFPWAVALDYSSFSEPDMHWYLCGGALINPQWVLTAAHCVHDTGGLFLRRVRVGHADLNDKSAFDVDIDLVMSHPFYDSRGFFDNDIALIKLASKLPFNNRVRPICLPQEKRNTTNLVPLTVAGWGLTNTTTLASAERLQVLELEAMENAKCTDEYRKVVSEFSAESSVICAIGIEEDTDSCKGDSGGPLMLLNEKSALELVGVVSFGGKKCDSKVPGVYTRVASYLDWIQETINKN